MKIKVALFFAIFCIGIIIANAEALAISCQLPEVAYNGSCANSTRSCVNSPQYSIPGTCIDAIENGVLVEKAYFNCLPGYVRQSSMCVNPCPTPQIPFEGHCSDPFPVCLNPPQNSLISTCKDAIINSVRVERFEFQCLPGYKKILNECLNPCISPQVLFNDVCVNPVSACLNPPANSVTSTCMDKIENGQRVENYEFTCKDGYKKQDKECISLCQLPQILFEGKCTYPLSACQNPPANAVTSTCMDKIENNQRIERNEFTCIDGYKKQDKECVSVCDVGKVDFGGQCLSAYSPCQIWPLNAANCVDKMDQGIRIEQFDFVCLPGFEKEGKQCIRKTDCPAPEVKVDGVCTDPVLSCLNAPDHSLAMSCVDSLSETGRIESYNFSCETGFGRNWNKCVSASELAPLKNETENFHLAPAGYYDSLITNETTSITNPFTDTNVSTLEGKAAAELYYRGVVRGYPDGLFRGQQPINRAETAKLLLLSRYNSVGTGSLSSSFTDVEPDAWYAKYVGVASQYEIIDGYPDHSFKPGDTVNMAEFIKMISRTFGLQEGLASSFADISPNDWFFPYAGAVQKYQLFPNRNTLLLPDTPLTRDEVAVAIYQYLRNR